MHNAVAYHLLTSAQRSPLGSFPQDYNTEYDIMWYVISLWPVWVGCPGFVLSQILVHSLPLQQLKYQCITDIIRI